MTLLQIRELVTQFLLIDAREEIDAHRGNRIYIYALETWLFTSKRAMFSRKFIGK